MISWKYYISRGRRDPKLWLERNNITNYEELCSKLTSIGVARPKKGEVSCFFKKNKKQPNLTEKKVVKRSSKVTHSKPQKRQPRTRKN